MSNQKSGFTLVELSIVLVIIGLLIGGVLVGQSLIKNTKKFEYIRELQLFKFHYEDFKSKFKQIPGDFSKRSVILGGARNGNGDGIIDWNGDEAGDFWDDLFYDNEDWEENYKVYGTTHLLRDPNAATTYDSDFYYGNGRHGTILRADWYTDESGIVDSENVIFYTNRRTGDGRVDAVSIKATTLLDIDKKIDDGLAWTGLIRGHLGYSDAASANTTCSYDNGGTRYYKVDEEDLNCRMLYLIGRF